MSQYFTELISFCILFPRNECGYQPNISCYCPQPNLSSNWIAKSFSSPLLVNVRYCGGIVRYDFQNYLSMFLDQGFQSKQHSQKFFNIDMITFSDLFQYPFFCLLAKHTSPTIITCVCLDRYFRNRDVGRCQFFLNICSLPF